MRTDLSCFGLVVQAALSDGVSFDPFAFEQDGLAASEVDVGWGKIVEALVVSAMVVVLDEGRDLRLKVFLEGVRTRAARNRTLSLNGAGTLD